MAVPYSPSDWNYGFGWDPGRQTASNDPMAEGAGVQSAFRRYEDDGTSGRYSRPTFGKQPAARDSYAERQDQMAQENRFLRQVGNPTEVVAGFLARDYARLTDQLTNAVKSGDRDGAAQVVDQIVRFRDGHADAIVSWAQHGGTGGAMGETLAKRAREILTDDFLDRQVSVGYDGRGRPVDQVTVGSFLQTGINTVGDTVANYLTRGFRSDLAELEQAARRADVDAVKAVADRMQQFWQDNQVGVTRWSQFGGAGGAWGAQLQQAAQMLSTGEYLDKELPFGPSGTPGAHYTIRDLIVNMPEELKGVVARQTASRYKVDLSAGRAMTDPDDPMYSVFSLMLNDVAAGEAMQKSQPGSQEGVDKVVRGRSGIKLIAEHMARHASDADRPDDLPGFYQAVYAGFGGALSAGQLDTLYRDYETRSTDYDFRSQDYFQSWREAASSSAPVEQRLVPDGNGGVRSVEVQSRIADPNRLFDARFDVVDRLARVGISPDGPLLNSSLRANAQRMDALERTMGATFATLGYGDALAATVAQRLSGYDSRIDPGVGSDAQVLDDAELMSTQASDCLGIGREDEGGDTGATLPGIASAMQSAIVRAYLGSRKTSSDKSVNGVINGGSGSAMRDAVADAFSRSSGDRNRNLSLAVTDKVLDNLRQGRNQSVREILEELGDYVERVQRPDGSEEMRPRTPYDYVSPRDGRSTHELPDPNQIGGFSMDPEVVRQSGMGPAQRFAARQELQAIRDGKSPLVEVGGADPVTEAEATAVKGLAGKILDKQTAALQTGRRADTQDASGLAGEVAALNLRLQGYRGVASLPFVKSGDLFRYLEGHDKTFGASSGDSELNRKAVVCASACAGYIRGVLADPAAADMEQFHAYVSLFATLVPDVLNRRYGDVLLGVSQDPARHGVADTQGAMYQVLLQTGLLPSVGSWTQRSDVFPYQEFAIRSVDDSDIVKLQNEIQTKVLATVGWDTGTPGYVMDVLHAAGYERPKEGEISTKTDYGGVLARFEELRRQPMASVATPTAGVDHESEDPDERTQVKEAALRLLGRSLSHDAQLNSLKLAYRKGIAPNFETPEALQAFLAVKEPLLDQVYSSSGLEGARDFVNGEINRILVFVPRATLDPQTQQPVERATPVWMDGAGIKQEMSQQWAGGSLTSLLMASDEMRKQYRQQLQDDAALNLRRAVTEMQEEVK